VAEAHSRPGLGAKGPTAMSTKRRLEPSVTLSCTLFSVQCVSCGLVALQTATSRSDR